MNGELKSKFRDRLKYFKKIFFLKKKKGSSFDLEEDLSKEKTIDNTTQVVCKPTFKIIYVKKKKNGIDNSLENLKLKNNLNNKTFNINVTNDNIKKNNMNVKNDSITKSDSKVIKVKYIKKKKKNIGIDDVYGSDFIDDPRLAFKNKFISNKKYKELLNKNDLSYDDYKKYLFVADKEHLNVADKEYYSDIISVNNFDKKKNIERKDRELLLNIVVGKLENKSKKMLYKLDNLYSDYYNILNYSEEEIEKSECEKRLKEIEKIKKEIDELSEQFNIINDDRYLDNILDLDDSNLIDDIIKYKDLCTRLIDKKEIYESYKKIDNYERVNTYLDKFTKRIDELKDIKEKKKEEIEKRDKDFILFKNLVNSVDIKNEKYFSVINSHVDVCNSILKNVGKIFKNETVDFRFRGLGELVSSSFRYLFYLSLTPFRGLFPSIAINAMASRDMIRSIRENLELEEIRKVNYYAKNYENEINKNIYDINNINNLLYSTLDDIDSLKKEFKEKYGMYIDKISEYEVIYKKIEKIEKMVKFNLDRVKKVEKSLNKSKEKNKNKLIKIKELNNKNN